MPPRRPNPAMKSPTPTTTMARTALAAVVGTSYLIRVPATVKPSIAMKCMDQIPVPPMAQAASNSHHDRWPPVRAERARAVQINPSREPRIDST